MYFADASNRCYIYSIHNSSTYSARIHISKSRCDHFFKYYVDKIETIRSKCSDKVSNIPSVQTPEVKFEITVFEGA